MPKSTPEKKSPPKGKLNSIMDAVTALTSLGDEDSTASGENPAQEEKDDANKPKADDDDSESAKSESKRFIPEHKKPDAALTFPEKVRRQPITSLDIRSSRRNCTVDYVEIDNLASHFVKKTKPHTMIDSCLRSHGFRAMETRNLTTLPHLLSF